MKIRLVEAGSFTGKRRVAETELSGYTPELAEQISHAFDAPDSTEYRNPNARDQEQLFLQLNERIIPLSSIPPSEELNRLVSALRAKLKWQK